MLRAVFVQMAGNSVVAVPGCSQMRQAGTSCTFDGFRYDGDRGESSAGVVLLKARATNDGGYLLGEETSDGGAWGKMTTRLL